MKSSTNNGRENMTERSRVPSSTPSPPASIGDIQKRLLRPSTAISSPEDVKGRNCSQRKVNVTQFHQRKQEATDQREVTKKKLEDYLDPVLLSAIVAKTGSAKKDTSTQEKLKREVRDFDWPVEELNVYLRNADAVNLGRDWDQSAESGSDEEAEFGTPF